MMGCMERIRDDIGDEARHEGLLGAGDAPGSPGDGADRGPHGDTAFEEGLAEHLNALERSDSWRVREVLKETPFETTELVSFVGAAGGELGPFIRKTINCAAGVGSAYERLMAYQRAGGCSCHLPRLVECVRTGDTIRVVMEWIEGERLDAYLARRGAGVKTACRVMDPLCDAVRVLHERFRPALIHRDLKPSNIVMRGDTPVLIDFGIARSWDEGATADTTHFGTRLYAPPEQFGYGQTDERSDVFALGCLLYECVTGEVPSAVSNAEPDIDDASARDLLEVADRARSFDPDARFASVSALQEAIRGACAACSLDTRRASQSSTGAQPGDVDETLRIWNSPFHGRLGALGRACRGWIARLRENRALRGVSAAAGVVWNGVLAAGYIVLLFAICNATFNPQANDVGLPLWFRALEYLFMCGISFTVMAYLLMDRRVLRRRFPKLARWSLAREIVVGASIIVGTIAVTLMVGTAVGLI